MTSVVCLVYILHWKPLTRLSRSLQGHCHGNCIAAPSSSVAMETRDGFRTSTSRAMERDYQVKVMLVSTIATGWQQQQPKGTGKRLF